MKQPLQRIYFLVGIFVSSLVAACWPGCTTDVNLDALRTHPKLVLNSRLAAGDTVSARVTRTWFYTEDKPDILLPDAEVCLYVNDEWKGRLAWQPADSRYGKEGCFLSSYQAAPGDRLRVEASHPDYEKASAEVTVPTASLLSDVQLSTRSYSHTGQRRIITDYDVTIRDDPDAPNYYLLELEEGRLLDSVASSDSLYYWTSLSLDFSRDPVLNEQATALDRFFGHDGSAYGSGQVFTDALFDGKEYVLKMSSSYYVYEGDHEYEGYGNNEGYDNNERYGNNEEYDNNERHDNNERYEKYEKNKKYDESNGNALRLLRFRLYTLTESYYLYLRSLNALEGLSFEGDMSELGLGSPVRVYSNIEGGGTGIVAAYATTQLTVSCPSEIRMEALHRSRITATVLNPH